jgi:hypothetical protein
VHHALLRQEQAQQSNHTVDATPKQTSECAALGFGKEGAAGREASVPSRLLTGRATGRRLQGAPRTHLAPSDLPGWDGGESGPRPLTGSLTGIGQPLGQTAFQPSLSPPLGSRGAEQYRCTSRGAALPRTPVHPLPQAGAGLPGKAGAGFRAHPGSRSPCYGRFGPEAGRTALEDMSQTDRSYERDGGYMMSCYIEEDS